MKASYCNLLPQWENTKYFLEQILGISAVVPLKFQGLPYKNLI